MSLSGRICVVTGASKGIGRGIAVQLGSASATVYITGRSKDKLEECAAEIKTRGGKVSCIIFSEYLDYFHYYIFLIIGHTCDSRSFK